ncbi:MAG: ankyrin repeat domain-containing protein [Candidatus Dependentiae bacterium]|nr:ankyrin repeat domain-containing protein [Candidatus Dependentiae bacterium]
MITYKKIARVAIIAQIIFCAESQLQASSWWGNADTQFIAEMEKKLKSAPVAREEDFESQNYLDTHPMPEDFDKFGQLIHPSRRSLIANIVKQHQQYKEGFQVIGLGDNGFYNFLQENLLHDENEDEESNAEQVLINAKEKITNGLKGNFISGLKEDNPNFVKDNFNTLYSSKTIDDLNEAIDRAFPLSRINNLKKLRDQKVNYAVKYSGVNSKINHPFLKDQIQEWIQEWMLNYDGSLLIWAIAHNNIAKVKLFLDAGTNIDHQNDYGCTPLMAAVADNRLEVVKLLFAAHPNINLQDRDGDTALHYAKTISVAEMLLDAGANPNIRNKEGQTPAGVGRLHIADFISEYQSNK